MARVKVTGSHGYVEGVVEHEKGVIRSAELIDDKKLFVDYADGRLSLESADGTHFTGEYVEHDGDRGKAEFTLYKDDGGNLLFFGESRSEQGARDYTWWLKLRVADVRVDVS